jgi:hypothetical protein
MKNMSLTFSLILLVFFVATAAAEAAAQSADLSGTWEGTAEVPDIQDLDKLTLVLEKNEGSYSGTITDSVGYANQADLENVEFKDSALSFSFQIFNGTSYQTILVTLTVDGNKMSGSWENDEGQSGNILLERISPKSS